MRIALDVMGGDKAPQVTVKGAVQAAREADSLGIEEIILVGDSQAIKKELSSLGASNLPLSIKPAREVIAPDEAAASAVKQKKDSSIVVATNLVKEGKADALVSAGHTGAVMASCLINLKRLKGISRPAIATLVPNIKGATVLLDAGANVDCKPKHLVQFALMGSVYAHYILGIEKPKVGLLSIGEEKSKGNELTFETYRLLENSQLNFIGNAEGKDIANGTVDVVVCDGFVGNVLLKFGESLAKMIMAELKEELSKGFLLKLGAFISRPAFVSLKRRLDYSEYGGAPLLGTNGVCIISHGKSSSKAIKNALRVASEFVRHKVNQHIEENL
ncbi:phosphate acyltransferase PlsX [bacterium]|nr:phosphate acyltransferase PlsX [bacterium]